MPIKYYVEIQQETGFIDYRPLTARTDTARINQTAKIAKANPDCHVFCAFERSTDGQHGYLNRDGNHDITGRAY